MEFFILHWRDMTVVALWILQQKPWTDEIWTLETVYFLKTPGENMMVLAGCKQADTM